MSSFALEKAHQRGNVEPLHHVSRLGVVVPSCPSGKRKSVWVSRPAHHPKVATLVGQPRAFLPRRDSTPWLAFTRGARWNHHHHHYDVVDLCCPSHEAITKNFLTRSASLKCVRQDAAMRMVQTHSQIDSPFSMSCLPCLRDLPSRPRELA